MSSLLVYPITDGEEDQHSDSDLHGLADAATCWGSVYLPLLPLAACEEEEEVVPDTLSGAGDLQLHCLSTDLAIHITRTCQHCDRYFIS